MRSKFIPFSINIIDVVEIMNAILLIITGNNIGQGSLLAIISGALYVAGKKFVEIGKAKTAAADAADLLKQHQQSVLNPPGPP